jgi:PAS domain-containing protein
MKDKKQPKEKLKSQSSNGSVDEKELIFQSSNDLMMYIDKFGKLLKINKAGLAFSGFSEKEVIGKMFWKLPGVLSTRNALKTL